MANLKKVVGKAASKKATKEAAKKNVRTKYRRAYTEEALAEAVERVTSRDISMKKAAAFYKIPMMTLSDHVNGKVAAGKLLFAFFLFYSFVHLVVTNKDIYIPR